MARGVRGGGGHRQQLFMARIVLAKDHHLANQHAGNHPSELKICEKLMRWVED